jgi:hypothetical protein
MIGFLIGLAVGLGTGFYAGGHPDQVKTRAGLFVAWIKTRPWRKS